MTTELLTLEAGTAEVSAERRTITGVACMFGVPSSVQRVTLDAGALTPRDPLQRVKLLLDHDATQPVGVLTSFEADDSQALVRFSVPEGAAGDAALESARSGLRDGLSVGFAVKRASRGRDGGITVHEAELYEVSLVATPDFAAANVTAVTASIPEETPTMTETTTTTEINTEPPATAAPQVIAASTDADVPSREFAAPPTEVTPRGVNLSTAVKLMADAINSGSPDAIRLALQDLVPADDAGTAFIGRSSWIGELFTASAEERPFIDAFGPVQQLDSIKATGWRWKVRPKVEKYTGNKADVPSNKPKTEQATFTAERWAGGWDVDRIFLDLGDPSFLAAFWQAAMAEYKVTSEADIAAKVIAAATASTTPATSVLGGIKQLAKELRAVGGRASTIFLADDIYDDFADLKASEVPFWLANAVGGVDIAERSATHPAGPGVQASSALAAGTILAIDKRGAIVREKQPIRVQGIDIARGGVDLGFYSYGRFDLHDPRVLRKVTVGTGGGG